MSNIKATLKDHMGSDLTVVNAARVSFGKESYAVAWLDYDYEDKSRCGDLIAVLEPRDQKLIRYLAKHKHLSPFGHAFASFHVKAPIFVARQLVKHKFLRWNEISRRYVADAPEFFRGETWRRSAENVKQGSGDAFSPDEDVTFYIQDEYEELVSMALECYTRMLRRGVAPEQARMVLPQSTMTEWYWSGSLDAFAAMCNLRCASDTQYESRVVADQISKVLGDLFPVAWEALRENA